MSADVHDNDDMAEEYDFREATQGPILPPRPHATTIWLRKALIAVTCHTLFGNPLWVRTAPRKFHALPHLQPGRELSIRLEAHGSWERGERNIPEPAARRCITLAADPGYVGLSIGLDGDVLFALKVG